MILITIPRMRAQAIVVIVTLPKDSESPPIPVMRIAETTKRFLFCSRSTFCIILRPLTAINP